MLLRRDNGTPWVKSFAHGGLSYALQSEDKPVEGPKPKLEETKPKWRERDRKGMPKPSMHNARQAIVALGIVCSYDTFHNKMSVGFSGDSARHELQAVLGEVTDNAIIRGGRSSPTVSALICSMEGCQGYAGTVDAAALVAAEPDRSQNHGPAAAAPGPVAMGHPARQRGGLKSTQLRSRTRSGAAPACSEPFRSTVKVAAPVSPVVGMTGALGGESLVRCVENHHVYGFNAPCTLV